MFAGGLSFSSFVVSPEGEVVAFGLNCTDGLIGVRCGLLRNALSVVFGGAAFEVTRPTLLQRQWPEPAMITCSGDNFSLLLDTEGGLWGCGRYSSEINATHFTPMRFGLPSQELPRFSYVAVGQYFWLAIDSRGSVWAAMTNTRNRNEPALGIGAGRASPSIQCIPDLPCVTKIACGARISLLEAAEGSLWGSGFLSSDGPAWTKHQRLPTGAIAFPLRSLAVGRAFFAVVDSNGALWTFGDIHPPHQRAAAPFPSTPLQHEELPPIQTATAGDVHLLLLDEAGYVWSSGANDSGQLGREGPPDRFLTINEIGGGNLAIAAGNQHSMVQSKEGILVFGKNVSGQLGLEGVEDRFIPTLLPGIQCRTPNREKIRPKSAYSSLPLDVPN